MCLITHRLPQLAAALAGIESWQYSTFTLEEACQGRALSLLAFVLMRRTGLVEQFRLDESKLVRFLVRIEDGYPGAH